MGLADTPRGRAPLWCEDPASWSVSGAQAPWAWDAGELGGAAGGGPRDPRPHRGGPDDPAGVGELADDAREPGRKGVGGGPVGGGEEDGAGEGGPASVRHVGK